MDNIKRQEVFAALAPDVTESFHKTVCDTLEGIILLEEKDQRAQERPRAVRPPWHSYRTLAFALLLALLLATAAVAARRWRIFDSLAFLTGSAPQGVDSFMQSDLAQVTVNGVDITIREAGYDGKTLFIQYSFRMNDVSTRLGINPLDGSIMTASVDQEADELLVAHNVGW